jgi:hypothetical protein
VSGSADSGSRAASEVGGKRARGPTVATECAAEETDRTAAAITTIDWKEESGGVGRERYFGVLIEVGFKRGRTGPDQDGTSWIKLHTHPTNKPRVPVDAQ